MDVAELIRSYGRALDTRNGALLVGAGLSRASGYPQWADLLEGPRAEAGIPEELRDLPLVAEYYVQSQPGGRERLESHILENLVANNGRPGPGHDYVRQLPLDDVWTTNYDTLLEEAIQDAGVVSNDGDLTDRRKSWDRRIIKMHGSLSLLQPVHWLSPPIITRSDYESYEDNYPRLWAALKAAFLTQSFLFLGFSFSDPNVEVLLRLARTRLRLSAPEHYTILRTPDDEVEEKLHGHRLKDLESSGIAVLEVSSYEELEPILRQLVRRTRPSRLFVGGSEHDTTDISPYCQEVGSRLSDLEALEVASLAGPAAIEVSYSFGKALKAREQYGPERVGLYFRRKDERPEPLEERIGTVIYTDQDVEELRKSVLGDCRAALVIGGGERTALEVTTADALGVPVIPLGASGGRARELWASMSEGLGKLEFGGSGIDRRDFELLAHESPNIAAAAAVRLIRAAMYLT